MCYVPTVGLMAATNACKGAIKTLAVGGRIASILNFVTLEQQLATRHLGEMALWDWGSTRMAQTTLAKIGTSILLWRHMLHPGGLPTNPWGCKLQESIFVERKTNHYMTKRIVPYLVVGFDKCQIELI
jgi:hypothetical protein